MARYGDHDIRHDAIVEGAPAGIWITALRACAIAALWAGFALASLWSMRVGWADYWFRRETVAGTEKAIAIAPERAAYHTRLALLLGDDDRARAMVALRRAVTLNPSDAPSWIELGLRAEASGDPSAAEQDLLQAAQVDAMYLPRWTLANYYFRRHDTARFWFWAKSAAAMAYGEPTPLFRLCGELVEDGTLIERLAIRDPDVRASYVAYLLGLDRLDLIGPATHALLGENREADVPLLLSACDRLLDQGDSETALEIWTGLGQARRIPSGLLGQRNGNFLSNASFAEFPSSHGFDWRLPQILGVSVAREESFGGLRFAFSGSQPENCETLFQFVPVRAGTSYHLGFLYRTFDIAADTGLTWRVTDGKAVLAGGESLSSEQEAEGQLDFETPPGCRLVRLALAYQRASGTTRIEGYVVLRKLRLAEAPLR